MNLRAMIEEVVDKYVCKEIASPMIDGLEACIKRSISLGELRWGNDKTVIYPSSPTPMTAMPKGIKITYGNPDCTFEMDEKGNSNVDGYLKPSEPLHVLKSSKPALMTTAPEVKFDPNLFKYKPPKLPEKILVRMEGQHNICDVINQIIDVLKQSGIAE